MRSLTFRNGKRSLVSLLKELVDLDTRVESGRMAFSNLGHRQRFTCHFIQVKTTSQCKDNISL